mgnify:CR=1 FL=1|tara:strand:- start:296 stop:505 length:210 start_codon:yes stop_codon:yes gene_type:complete
MEIFEDMYKTGILSKKVLDIRTKQLLYSHRVANFCNNGLNCFTSYKHESVKQEHIFNDYKKKDKISYSY